MSNNHSECNLCCGILHCDRTSFWCFDRYYLLLPLIEEVFAWLSVYYTGRQYTDIRHWAGQYAVNMMSGSSPVMWRMFCSRPAAHWEGMGLVSSLVLILLRRQPLWLTSLTWAAVSAACSSNSSRTTAGRLSDAAKSHHGSKTMPSNCILLRVALKQSLH